MLLTDRAAIRAVLLADPIWSLYARGDLTPGLFEHCEWRYAPGPPPALLLLIRAFAPPVLYAQGSPDALAALFDNLPPERAIYLSIPLGVLPLIQQRWRVSHVMDMWRMSLPYAGLLPQPPSAAERRSQLLSERLSLADLPDLESLYADGVAAGEAPDFFYPAMLESGVFYGVREGGALIAAAGTHLVAPEEGVAALGNVYTRRDRRGRGLARAVTGAVVSDLLRLPAPLILGLNVSQANPAALRVYQQLGFVIHCGFYEGLAESNA